MKFKLPAGLLSLFGSHTCTLATLAISASLYAQPALAHHPLGGRLPSNSFEGLMSGLAHPLISPDHFLFVLAVGFLAVRMTAGLWLPVLFVLGGLVGALFHLGAGNLPLLEVGVTVSLVLAGLCLAKAERPSSVTVLCLGSLAGIFHGYAFAEAIIGAEAMPLGSYLVGLTVIQLAVATTVWIGLRFLSDRIADPTILLRYAGFGFLGAGLAFFSGLVVG